MEQNEQENGAVAGPDDQARAESLAAIQGEVLDAEPVEGTGEGGYSGTVPMNPADEAKDLIQFGLSLFMPLYPSLEVIYTPEKQERLAAVTGPLMAKYNLSLGSIFEKWGAEINFAIVALPLAAETAKAVRADNAAREAAARKAKEDEEARRREAGA
ncbi:hypothetical protein RY831_27685 [Noviherbaspirillum sp. CPCC 100848]|uniref:Uncharacterized protein n=1 Tax=Noviherbaspirillum album TaxID=3080276 RepID=A0ABU6JHH8_9BURK|nr:hypothetical protein [Noviherbaspirillum sp. CPCC 100848]MEC4722946.1 hypothetical protein [Noviherbaspirillum sp. CPCC 100848]